MRIQLAGQPWLVDTRQCQNVLVVSIMTNLFVRSLGSSSSSMSLNPAISYHASMVSGLITYLVIKRFKNVSGSIVKAIYATTCIDESIIIKTVAFYCNYHRYDTGSESKTLFRE